jgi:hypothetical protein
MTRLEDKSGTLGLLVTTKLEVLATLEGELCKVLAVANSNWCEASYLCLGLALCALQTENDLLGGFRPLHIVNICPEALMAVDHTLWKTGLV